MLGKKDASNIDSILIVATAVTGRSGGDVHLNHMIKYWKKSGININPLYINEFKEFNLLNNLKYLFISTDKLLRINHLTTDQIQNSDVILSATPYPANLFHSIKLSKKYHKKVICYFHQIVPGIFNHSFPTGFFRTILNAVYFKYAMYLVEKNDIAIFLDYPDSLKNPKIKVYEDLDAVDEINISSVNKCSKIYDLCYLGRVVKSKGIMDLIKVCKLLSDSNINLKIAIVGEYSAKMKTKLDKLLNKYKLSNNFIFFGYVDNIQKLQLLSSSKIFISLSYEEGWGISAMEAAALGIPLIVYKLPGAYSYLNGNYYSAPVGDINKIKTLIVDLIKNIDAANSYTQEAMRLVKTYHYSAIAEEQLRYIEDFLNR